MKTGIITITGEMNYGNSFQNYAVVKVLENLGVSAETVKTEYGLSEYFRMKKQGNFKLKPFLKFYGRILIKHKMFISYLFRRLKFNFYNRRFLNLSKKRNFELSPVDSNKYDAYIFGSDQIWNFTLGRMCNSVEYFTGGFAPDVKKIAYSASIGVDYIPEKYIEKVRENLNDFSAISVREDKGKEILDPLLEKPVCVTVDPTLMLDKSEWQKISKKPNFFSKNKKFILTYFLGEYSDELIKYVKKTAEKLDCEIIDLCSEWSYSHKREKKKYYAFSPREFLWLIDNCQVMFTDSFHGSVFSIIMDKPFRCFERREDGIVNMSSRMDTLFSTFKINDWCVGDINESIDNILFKDYSNVQSILTEKREFAYDYLKGALDIK
ncbi:MAG: polysaccharide pyruvyl transferase family protein [Eubacterium sp.]